MEKEPVNRRDFLKGLGAAAAVAGFGGILKVLTEDKEFLRPPGAVAEDDFLALCMRCQKCVGVCPTRVVLPLTISKSIVAGGTPTLHFDKGYCDSCMECTLVCPSGALEPIAKEQVKIGIAQINKDTCIAWQWMGCVKCTDACPYAAITLDSRQRPVVDAQKCNGCGLCEQICPSGSLRSYSAQAQGKGIVVVPIKRA